MRILEIADKDLFLKYAVPCGEVLVSRGSLDRKTLEGFRRVVADGRRISDDIAESFPVAARMTSIIAQRMGKEKIDEEVIRRYFLFEHDHAVRWRASIWNDVRIDECLIQPGRIVRREGDSLVVNTPSGEKTFRGEFVPEAGRGDFVTLHYDFISEIAGRKNFETLKRMRL